MPTPMPNEGALILIDVQNDFCPGGSLAVESGDEIVPVINSLSTRFSRVIATQDWHPPGHISFASAHEGRKPFETVQIDTVEQVLWPDHCLQGSGGAELHPDLNESSIDLILHKGTSPELDSYSAFFENDHETPTGLEYYLRGLHIEELFFCGLATDVCVHASVMDALKLGFACTIIVDAMKGVSAADSQRAIAEMVQGGARRATSKELRG